MRHAAAALIVLVIAGSTGAAAVWLRPDQSRGAAFLFGDEGHNIYVAAALADGAELYTGVSTPYGPATAWTYRAASAVAGNTPAVYQTLNLLLSIASLMLLQRALARHGHRRWAVAWTILALVPSMLAPGSLLGGLTVSTYIGLERLAIACLVWGWRPPEMRGHRRSAALGAIAGALVWVRFGTTALVLIGLLIADVSRRGRHWKPPAIVVGGALLAVATFAAWTLAVYPVHMATDLLWPSFLKESYGWVTQDVRWPAFTPLTIFFAQYGPPLAGLILLIVALSARRSAAGVGPAVLLAATFLAGTVLTFQHAFHFRQYAWLLAAAGGFAGISLSTRWRASALLAAAPAYIVIVKALVAPAVAFTEVRTPAAGAVFLTPAMSARASGLARFAAERAAEGQGVLIAPSGAGWHAAFDVPVAGRHAWFPGGVVRPWEYDEVVERFGRLSAVVVCPESTDPWSGLYLPRAVVDRVRPLFESRGRVADCALLLRR